MSKFVYLSLLFVALVSPALAQSGYCSCQCYTCAYVTSCSYRTVGFSTGSSGSCSPSGCASYYPGTCYTGYPIYTTWTPNNYYGGGTSWWWWLVIALAVIAVFFAVFAFLRRRRMQKMQAAQTQAVAMEADPVYVTPPGMIPGTAEAYGQTYPPPPGYGVAGAPGYGSDPYALPPPPEGYKAPETTYAPPAETYAPPTTTYAPPTTSYAPPTTSYAPPTSEAGVGSAYQAPSYDNKPKY